MRSGSIHCKRYTPNMNQIEKVKILGTHSNSTKISIDPVTRCKFNRPGRRWQCLIGRCVISNTLFIGWENTVEWDTVKWPIHVCDMTHSYVWHGSFIWVTWLIRMCDMAHSYLWHDPFICVTWLIYMCDMTHLYVKYDWFICVIWLIRMCDMTHSYVRRDSFICVTWLIRMWDMTHS